MSARRKSIRTSADAPLPERRNEQAGGVAGGSQDVLEDTRAKWIQDRREELDRVFDVHDSLIREAFHLEKFVSLLSYDPKTAKQDRSDVFQRFQAQYDLVDHTSSAGPSRRTTRRAHTERLQGLKAHGLTIPLTPTKTHKPEDSPGPSAAFWDIRAEAKTKGKPVQGDSPGVPSPHMSHGRKGKYKQVVVEIPPRPKTKSSRRASVAGEHTLPTDAVPDPDGLSQPPPRKKRRLTDAIPSPRHALRSAASMPKLTAPDAPLPALSAHALDGASLHQDTQPPPSPVKHPVPRVKLIVRKPPTMLTNPRQRPAPPMFGGSVEALLSSFTYRYDREVETQQEREDLDADLAKELALWRRVDDLRRQGRFIERSSYRFVDPPPQDAWASIVAEMERPEPKLVSSQDMSSNVAGKLTKYWEGENKVEEARLRNLARSTLRVVIEQWKKAVYHVREQARLEWEAEERRRGQEHLNAILNQSGQILSVQLHDLARDSRSRSRSVSTHGREHTPVLSEDEVDEDGDASGSDQASSDSESSAADEGIAMLVPDLEIESVSQVGQSGNGSMEVDMDLETTTSEGEDDEAHPVTPAASEPQALAGDPNIQAVYGDTTPTSPIIPYAAKLPLSMDIDDDPDRPALPASLLPPNGSIPKSTQRDAIDGDSHMAASPTQPAVVSSGPLSTTDSTEDDTAIPAKDDAEPPTPLAEGSPSLEIIMTASGDATPVVDDDAQEDEVEEDASIPYYLRPYAVAPVEWDPQAKVKPPLLLRGTLRPYQQAGLEWLSSIHTRNLNGILADEMGLGKTIQTIALLAHLACDRGIWGPHLIIVPTSVLLNWEMEFKKFLPGFKVLSYHGSTKQRKELRQGWNNKYHFNACITSYTLASRDSHVFKRKRWYYMILDEAHMIKNFKSQRWNILLMFRSFRRLLLTGTPLQNNLTELWALLQFLMSGTDFANLKEFGEWFANPLERAIELGAIDDETQQRVSKLHAVLRPYLLRRLKRDVEKELPQKYEHIVICHLSKRQRFLYDEFMSRAETRHDLQSGVYQKIANILMQLRKVVNHPDLFEVRPIVTSFAMQRSAVADYEIKELLVRRRLLEESDEETLNLEFLGLRFVDFVGTSEIAARETRRLDGTGLLPMIAEVPVEPPPRDTRTIAGFKAYREYQRRAATIARWAQIGYINRLRCSRMPVYSGEALAMVRRCYNPLLPPDVGLNPSKYLSTPEKARSAVTSYARRAEEMSSTIDRFAFATPNVVARDLPSLALSGLPPETLESIKRPEFDAPLHRASVKLSIAFPDPSLLQYDCGKLQMLDKLLRERKAGGHRILIFTQMTRILDLLEIFLNLHGYLYLRLDGATKIEDRQYITERFNSDPRIFCFISSSRSGGVGINLTGADTVIFYDSDFNPQMDRQCEDRAHRIGQIRDVHIYRFISQHTVEEALLRKANQKRALDDVVIQKGAFDWRTLLTDAHEGALTRALGEYEDAADAQAARVAAREELQMEDEDARDFDADGGAAAAAAAGGVRTEVRIVEPERRASVVADDTATLLERGLPADNVLEPSGVAAGSLEEDGAGGVGEGEGDEEEGRTIDDYMVDFVQFDPEFFSTADWNV
ncbi:SNF2 family N-terminal domain-containing protein [Daedaleopsis nitida]|nr:SNF2 family N-terminal domain-containing protein [Daedaleopsis nitida]